MLDEPMNKHIESRYTCIQRAGLTYKGYLIKASEDNSDVFSYIDACAEKCVQVLTSSKEPVERLNHELYQLQGIEKAIAMLAVTRLSIYESTITVEIALAKALYVEVLTERLKEYDVLINLNGGITPIKNYETISV